MEKIKKRRKRKRYKDKHINIRCSGGLVIAIKEAAKKLGITPSILITLAIEEYISTCIIDEIVERGGEQCV